MEKIDTAAGLRLREGREAMGWTLDQAARQVDYSKGALSNIENGRDKPGRRLYEKLLILYGLRRE